ncbi:MAG TPA: SRPBCC family protein [Devosiaceae bacterium]|jgi:hypothetical protein
MLDHRIISTAIAAPYEVVYGFLSRPENMPKWAEGLGHSFDRVEDSLWRVATPMGSMLVRFTPRNAFGIVDHWVIPDGGEAMYNPMRVVAHGEGTVVAFTLFRRADMDDEKFAADAAWVTKDLAKLKALLEA